MFCYFQSTSKEVIWYKKFLNKGSFKNYVDKMRWVGGQKMAILVHVQGNKCPCGGREVVKKGQIMYT